MQCFENRVSRFRTFERLNLFWSKVSGILRWDSARLWIFRVVSFGKERLKILILINCFREQLGFTVYVYVLNGGNLNEFADLRGKKVDGNADEFWRSNMCMCVCILPTVQAQRNALP